jgi:hypothetical protein
MRFLDPTSPLRRWLDTRALQCGTIQAALPFDRIDGCQSARGCRLRRRVDKIVRQASSCAIGWSDREEEVAVCSRETDRPKGSVAISRGRQAEVNTEDTRKTMIEALRAVICKDSFGTGRRRPTVTWGKTNCRNCSRFSSVGMPQDCTVFPILTLKGKGSLYRISRYRQTSVIS